MAIETKAGTLQTDGLDIHAVEFVLGGGYRVVEEVARPRPRAT